MIIGLILIDNGSLGYEVLIVIRCLYDELYVDMNGDEYEIIILPRLFAILLMYDEIVHVLIPVVVEIPAGCWLVYMIVYKS